MAGALVRLLLLDEAKGPDGAPRAALWVPPSPGRYGKRPVILLFGSLAAALAAKRDMEGVAHARPA